MLNIKRFFQGLKIVPKSSAQSDTAGEMEVISTDSNKLTYHNGSTRSPVVTESHTATLTNKTIDADSNTITNIENADIKAGAAIDAAKIANGSVSNAEFQYLDGVTSSIQTQINSKASQTDLDNHINDTSGAHAASAISVTPTGALAATDAQAAFAELDGDITLVGNDLAAHILDSTDAHDASAISNVPSGNLSATDIQAAVNELQSDIDTRATSSALSAHTGASSGVHGVTGSVVGTTDTQTLTNKTLTAPTINNGTVTGASIVTPARLDAKKDTKANLVTYAASATNGEFAFATDEKKYYGTKDSTLIALGSGSQGLDTFVQLYAEEQITDWSTGNNATFLGGGTIAGTFARITSGQLNGDASYRFTQAAGSLNDYVASAVQSVPVRFRGTTVSVTFPYTYDGNNSDIALVVWDVTNSAKLTDDTNNALSALSNGLYRANISIPTSCTQIRVGFQVKTANSGKVLNFDDVQVSANNTAFVNTSETQSAFVTLSTPADSADLAANVTTSSGGGIFTLNTNGTITVRRECVINVTYRGTFGITQSTVSILVNGTTKSYWRGRSGSAGVWGLTAALSERCIPGDVISFSSAEGNSSTVLNVVATASNSTIVTASESFSTDTASLVYAPSTTYTLSTLANAPVGTFITFTFPASSYTPTQTTTAPTQTTSSMNTNGIQLFAKSYASLSTAASPARVAIQIGKGMKGVSVNGYAAASKTTQISLDTATVSTTSSFGSCTTYNELTGILDISVAEMLLSAGTKYVGYDSLGGAAYTSGYFVINASKSPALVGVPQVQPRFATISDVKSSGTAGGSFTSGAYQTRTLNTLVDSTGIVTSLASNQFTLPAGTYYMDAWAQAKDVNTHKLRIRNITDSTDVANGVPVTSNSTAGEIGVAFARAEVVITSSKVFEVQHRCLTTRATDGFGGPATFGDNEVYCSIKITRVK